MESIKKLIPEELEKVKHEVYSVIIGDSYTGHLRLELRRHEFDSLNIGAFINLGLIVTVHKTYDNVQDIK